MKVIDKHSALDWQAFIAPIANRLLDFSKRNPLFNLSKKTNLILLEHQPIEGETDQLTLEITSEISKLLKQEQFILKETGLQTLYLSYGTYQIQLEESHTLPLYLIPVQTQLSTEANTLEIQINWEEKVENPLLVKLLKERFNLELDAQKKSSDACYLGIFNYKKYVILNEILSTDEKNLSNPLRQLYDFNPLKSSADSKPSTIDDLLISEADQSQRVIIEKSLGQDSFCVQGPPGTGKSQTISNMIASNLKIGKKILFLSEKKAAIDIVFEKLKEVELDASLCLITDSKNDKKNFIRSLEKQWEENKINNPISLKKEDFSAALTRIQLYYANLFRNRPELGGHLIELLKSRGRGKLKLKRSSQIPDYNEWKKLQPLFNELLGGLEREEITETELKSILKINFNLIGEKDCAEKLELHLKILQDNLKEINNCISETDLEIKTFNELVRICIQARIIVGLKFKEKIEILRNEAKEKKFLAEAKKYLKLQTELKNLKLDLKHWTKIPSSETIHFLQKNLKKGNFLSADKRKAKLLLKEHTEHVAVKDLENLYAQTFAYFEVEKKCNQVLTNLQTEFEIHNPDLEIAELKSILNKSEYQKDLFDKLLSQKHSFIQKLDQLNTSLDKVQHSSRVLFSGRSESIVTLNTSTQSLVNAKLYILKNVKIISQLSAIDQGIISFIDAYEGELSKIEETLFTLNIEQVFEKSKILSESTKESINKDINEVIATRKRNLKYNAFELKKSLKTDFKTLEDLLITPAGRLNTQKKNLKKEVRNGKRILTHEFSKSQRFKAIRELCELESKNWIFQMKKVWMMNPLSVSEILPFEKEQFDLLIIDEASQIPEEDLIPALYRAKQVIIVGDKMQMPPSNFFSGNEVGPSILDIAHYRLENFMLKWHYRSKNPDLIAFSNQAFYDSQLFLSPSIYKNQQAFEYHFVKDSNYKEGSNPKEADFIIASLEANLKTYGSKNICIASFSLNQQQTIEKALNMSKKSSFLQKMMDSGQLFIRNLENLQGDECDILLISMGYGPDINGKVSMNFGALSRSGGHNRLNVLITRAREKIIVFSSIPEGTIRMSENEGINYLKEYLKFIQESQKNTLSVIEKEEISIQKNELVEEFQGIYLVSKSNQEKREKAFILVEEELNIEALLSQYSVLLNLGFQTEVIDAKMHYFEA